MFVGQEKSRQLKDKEKITILYRAEQLQGNMTGEDKNCGGLGCWTGQKRSSDGTVGQAQERFF